MKLIIINILRKKQDQQVYITKKMMYFVYELNYKNNQSINTFKSTAF